MNFFKRLFHPTPKVDLPAALAARLAAWQAGPGPAAETELEAARFVVVDIESSGLSMRRDHLISIGAVVVEGLEIDPTRVFSVVLKQETATSRENILVHGIGGQAQMGGAPPAEALLDFLEFIGNDPLVAFNAFFDDAMIGKALKRYLGCELQREWHDLAWLLPQYHDEHFALEVPLDDWLNAFDIHTEQRHDAVADAFVTAQLLQIVTAQALLHGAHTLGRLGDVERRRRQLRRSIR